MASKGDYHLQLQDPDDTKTRQGKSCLRFFVCFGVLVLCIGVAVFIAGIVILNKGSSSPCGANKLQSVSSCEFSSEARRIGLPDLLTRIKDAYYEYNPSFSAWKPDLIGKELTEFVKRRLAIYCCTS